MSKPPAGKHERGRIEVELAKLSLRQRCAFAAACAERVLPIVHDYLSNDSLCEAAVEMTWRFACAEAFDEAEAEELWDKLEGLNEELHDDDETGATLRALYAVIFALECTWKTDSESACSAASEATDAADGDMDDGETHIQEEAAWQIQALEITLKTASATRDMFAAIATEPAWLRAFRARDTGPGDSQPGVAAEAAAMAPGLEGLYLEQLGKEYHFLRLYPDGELLFASMTYTWPRSKALADVTSRFMRGHEKLHVRPYRFRYDDGNIAFEYKANGSSFAVRGEVDALGRVALVWRNLDLRTEWLHVYSKIGDKGETLFPVHVNVTGPDILAELPGLNKSLAARIVAHRDEHGNFSGPGALLAVKGITEAKLAALGESFDFAPAPALRVAAKD